MNALRGLAFIIAAVVSWKYGTRSWNAADDKRWSEAAFYAVNSYGMIILFVVAFT